MIGYFNWQRATTDHPRYNKGKSPALVDLLDYLLKRWGGQGLGIFNLRSIRGGTSWSTHAFGAALDWRYTALGRALMLRMVLPFLIANHKALGIQMIEDYVGCRVWKADRADDVNGGWKMQTPSSTGMGQSWAAWLHIEIHPDFWADDRDVETKLGIVAFPPFEPAWGLFSLWPYATNKPVLRQGATGDVVRYLQGVLRCKALLPIGVDGNFGPITAMVVRAFQQAHGLTPDSVVGPKTWAVIDQMAGR